MSTFEFQTHISANGEVAPIPGWTGGEADVRIIVVTPKTNNVTKSADPARVLPNGKSAIDDFIDFFTSRPVSNISDEEIDQAKFDYLMEKHG